LDSGKEYIRSGQYDLAIQQFDQALDAATHNEAPRVHYYLAYAYSLSGDTREALKQAAGLQPSGADEWASDFIILKAKLLVDSSAFAQAIAWLTQNGNDLSGDAQRAAIYDFLLGVGYRGVGDTSNEKVALSKVTAMSAESDLGKAAAGLLQNP
jgi:tetratricopeptide (TPR) repeat protein